MNHTEVFARFLFLLIPLWGFLTACSARGTSLPTLSAAAVSERKELEQWRIELSISGGFAGIRRSVELSSTGQLTVTDRKTNKQITIQVSEMELKKIASLVTQAQPVQPASRLSNCRDCFEYEITIQRDGERFSSWINELTLDNTELAPLINTLINLQERALSGQLKP